MKAILVLFLISLTTCLTIKEKIECFTKNNNFLKELSKIIESFKTKDFKTILNTGLTAYLSVKDEIISCLKDEEPVLKMTYCAWKCRHSNNKPACIDACENGKELMPIHVNATNATTNEK